MNTAEVIKHGHMHFPHNRMVANPWITALRALIIIIIINVSNMASVSCYEHDCIPLSAIVVIYGYCQSMKLIILLFCAVAALIWRTEGFPSGERVS